MTMNRSGLLSGTGLLAAIGLCMAGPALAGHRNPADAVSNPNGLRFTDVDGNRAGFTEVFVRDGAAVESSRFREIAAGVPQAKVQTLLGHPLLAGNGKRGTEWDYTFKFLLAPSQNYVVCQYKVVFDDQQMVREQVWRRRQCQDLAQTAALPQPLTR